MRQPAERASARRSCNILSSWPALALTALVHFVRSPFIVRKLGPTEYGDRVLLYSLMSG